MKTLPFLRRGVAALTFAVEAWDEAYIQFSLLEFEWVNQGRPPDVRFLPGFELLGERLVAASEQVLAVSQGLLNLSASGLEAVEEVRSGIVSRMPRSVERARTALLSLPEALEDPFSEGSIFNNSSDRIFFGAEPANELGSAVRRVCGAEATAGAPAGGEADAG